MKPLLASVSLALLLAGCGTAGPDYRLPAGTAAAQPAAQAAFAGANEAGVYDPAPVPPDWWRLYRDARLDDLIARALAANADLRVAAANLARAEAITREVQAQQQPGVSLNASPGFGHGSGVQALAPGVRPADHFSYSGSVAVSYQADLFGQIARAVEAAQGDAQAARAALDTTRITVVAETARAYSDLCAAGMERASAQRSMDVQRESVAVAERLAAAGRGTALDVSRARAQLDQLRAALPPLDTQRRVALYRLATLTGAAPTALDADTALAGCTALPQLGQPIPVGDGAALLRRRPDIRQAERTLAAATARIGVATADLYPHVSLGLSAGSAGPATRVGERGTYSWSLGPLISWTLPNTGAVQARIAQAEAGTQAALARFDATVLTALRETEAALTTYARQLDRDAALAAARDHSAEAAGQARRLHRAGKTDYLTVLDAERTLAGAESALAASRAQLGADQIAVFLALGGGWETPAVTASAPRP